MMSLKQRLVVGVIAMALAGFALTETAQAEHGGLWGSMAYRRSQVVPWHGWYAHPGWGGPVALVVPPKAGGHTEYSWGVSGTHIDPIYHQFGRPYPGDGIYGGSPFYYTPRWPSDTGQFGVYYIRGPW